MAVFSILPRSLRVRISLAVFFVFSLSLVIALLYLHNTLHVNVKGLLKAQHLSTASNIATTINQALDERLQGLEKAAHGARKALLTGPNAMQNLVEQRPVLQNMFNGGIIAHDIDGTAIADFPYSTRRVSVNYMDIDVVATALKNGHASIGDPVIGKKLKTVVFGMGAPIHDALGKVIGGLSGVVSFNSATFIDRIATTVDSKKIQYLLFSPQQRMVLTSTYKQHSKHDLSAWMLGVSIGSALQGFEGSFLSTDPSGMEQFISMKKISSTGWYLAITSPTRDIFATLYSMERDLTLIALLMMALAGCLIWWVVRYQLSPMACAAQSLDLMISKEQPLQQLPVFQNDEVGRLINGFNQLLSTLTQRETALKDSQYFFEESQRAACIGSYRSDFVIDRWETSEVCDQIFGIESDYNKTIEGWAALVHPQDVENMIEYVTEEVIGQNKPFNKEYRVIRKKDGETRWMLGLGETISDENGTCIGLIGTIQDITERKQIELALSSEQSLLSSLIDTLPDLIWLKNKEGVYLRCNHRFEQFFGASKTDIINNTDYDFIDKELADFFRKRDCEMMEKNQLCINEEEITFASDGHRELLETTKVPMRNDNGELIGILGIGHNITERKKTEDQLKLAASVFTHAREGIVITDAKSNIIEVNETFTTITGYSRAEVLGKNPRFLQSGRQNPLFYTSMWSSLLENKYWTGELWNRRKSGEVYAEIATISAITDSSNTVQNYVALFTDITSIKEHQQQLEHIAHYDALTNLPNRILLAERLHQAMVQCDKTQQSLAVAYLDLDGFKSINDRYGHEVGDELLIKISQRMGDTIREGDTIARIGGDEFVVILAGIVNMASCEQILARLLQASMDPVTIDNTILKTTVSIGVTLYPQDGADADQLMRHADQAMYIAKQDGKNRYHMFDVKHNTAIQTQRESLSHVKRALELKEFILYYQPKVNMKTGRVTGVEALIRWQHPERGLMAPASFLPIIENHPISLDIGEWVIATALAQHATWQSNGLCIPVSVNVSAYQLLEESFVTKLSAALTKHPQMSPRCLELEILETSALEDMAKVSTIMQACRKLGVSFSLDDFGTGYSSLTYLKRLPANILKIDQSFVRDMLDDPDDKAIVQAVIGLAAAFERHVIAEGVESIEHGIELLAMGCELAQGYGIARPMPATEIAVWVTQWKPDPTWTKQGILE
ncbi:MAG: EAL domain-containing protein [Oceanospirillaceae bacterium]